MRRLNEVQKVLLGISSFLVVFISGIKTASAQIIFGIPILGGAVNWILGLLKEEVAGDGLLESAGEWVIKLLFSIINYIIILFTTVLFSVAGALIKFAIKVNSGLENSPIVEAGYDTVLKVANLGLVVAIIVVAFMVMLRRNNAQKLLVRFILVALIINFGHLILTTWIVRPVDEITSNIEDAINIGETGFAGTFSGVFLDGNISPQGAIESIIEGAGEKENFVITIAKGITTSIFLLTVGLVGFMTLLAVGGMLLVRYIAMSILIILFPIVILSWIFPNFKITGGDPWNLWLGNFTRWLLFGPISLFFVWLAVGLTVNLSTNPNALEGGGGDPFFVAVGNMFAIVGLLLGGIIVANKMGIMGASYAKSSMKKVQAYAKGKVKLGKDRAVNTALNSEKNKERIERMQQKRGLRFAGRQLNMAGAKAEKRVNEAAKKKTKDLDPKRLAAALPTLSDPDLVEALNTLREKEALDLVDTKKYIGDEKTKQSFQRYGREKDYEKIEKARGFNTAMIKALEAGDDKKLEEETEKFHKSYKGGDVKLIGGGLFKDPNNKDNTLRGFTDDEFEKLRSVALNSTFGNIPGTTARIRAQLDHDSLIELQNELESTINHMEQQFVLDPRIDKDTFEKMEVKQKVKVIQDVYGVEAASVSSSLYGSRKNFGSSIFGSMPTPTQAQQVSGDTSET